MKPQLIACLTWLVLLIPGPFAQPRVADAQAERPFPQLDLTQEASGRLAEAAKEPGLATWQRHFMMAVAGGPTKSKPTSQGEVAPAPTWPAQPRSTDGGWSELYQLARSGHAAIYDPVRDRMVVFGGHNGSHFNDVWTLSLSESPAWSKLAPQGTPPSPRSAHTAIYDPVRDRMVVFGGWGGTGPLNDVWALSLGGNPTWTHLAPAGGPPGKRGGHTAIYDPVRDGMVVFGGLGDGILNDVWELSLAGNSAWVPLTPAGSPPSGRYGHTAIYDPGRDRLVVFGGLGVTGQLNDAWELALAGSSVWTELVPAGTPPSERVSATAIYDPVRGRMVVFGGHNPNGSYDDVWALSLSDSPSWILLTPTGGPVGHRKAHTSIYDPIRDRMVVLGGEWGDAAGTTTDDVWALSLSESPGWSLLTPGRPAYHTAIYDPARDRMVVFGGRYYVESDHTYHYLTDVSAVTLAGAPAVNQVAPDGTPPSARAYHTAIYDPVRDRMIVFGGYDGGGTLNDVWTLSLSGNPTWSAVAPAGSPPSGRYQHTAIRDPVRDRMIVFGGYDGSSILNDVWALSLAGNSAWTQLTPAGGPGSRFLVTTAIYDPVRDRMVVLGNDSGNLEVWALSLSGNPAWNEMIPTGSPTTEKDFEAAIYDPVRDRLVTSGAKFGDYFDVWALTLSDNPYWTELGGGPSPLTGHSAIYDPVRDRMVVFNGNWVYPGHFYRTEAWALTWGTPTSVPGDAKDSARGLQLAAPRPNPSWGEATLEFHLSEPSHVTLDVLDVHGRRVKSLADAWFAPGHHASTWGGDDDRGRAVGTGVYFVRVQAGGSRVTRRIVHIR